MATNLKILVCGDVDGKFKQLYNRINSIQKKAGVFDMLFCVGNFFGDDNQEWKEYLIEKSKACIPTFILGPNKPGQDLYYVDPNGCELCPNITFLGKKGVYSTSSGLTVAYLSGIEAVGSEGEGAYFDGADINKLKIPIITASGFKGVDVLLTSQWPKAVERYANSLDNDSESGEFGSAAISQLALSLMPRYHFCGLEGIHYERLPYRNHKVLQGNTKHVTRFIGLAKVGNPTKKKYLYAFNISPMKHIDNAELIKQPDDVTECPYKTDSSAVRNTNTEEGSAPQFFYDQRSMNRGAGRGKRSKGDDIGPANKRKPPQPTGPCWFCLGSPEVEKHLVCSVGDHVYIALAKGGLVDEHVLILPIGHHQSIVTAPDEVVGEIEKYKSALRKYHKARGELVIFFERNFKSQHLQIQCVPVPQDVGSDIKDTFQTCAQKHKFELQEIPPMTDLKQVIPVGAPYFYAELPTDEKLLTRIQHGRFPLQFGREVIADSAILNMPENVDWKNCKISKDEETDIAGKFRSSFQPYDFNAL